MAFRGNGEGCSAEHIDCIDCPVETSCCVGRVVLPVMKDATVPLEARECALGIAESVVNPS